MLDSRESSHRSAQTLAKRSRGAGFQDQMMRDMGRFGMRHGQVIGGIEHSVELKNHGEAQSFIGIPGFPGEKNIERRRPCNGLTSTGIHKARAGDTVEGHILNREGGKQIFVHAPKMRLRKDRAGIEVCFNVNGKRSLEQSAGALEHFRLKAFRVHLENIGARNLPFGHERIKAADRDGSSANAGRWAADVFGFPLSVETAGVGIGRNKNLTLAFLIAKRHCVVGMSIPSQRRNDFLQRIEAVDLEARAKTAPARGDPAVYANVNEYERRGQEIFSHDRLSKERLRIVGQFGAHLEGRYHSRTVTVSRINDSREADRSTHGSESKGAGPAI